MFGKLLEENRKISNMYKIKPSILIKWYRVTKFNCTLHTRLLQIAILSSKTM